MIQLMAICNSPELSRLLISSGVNRIFVDIEQKGKLERQAGLDTVKSNHAIQDISNILNVVPEADILLRLNPFGEWTQAEVEAAIAHGAKTLMLPYYSTLEEVSRFLEIVNGRVRTNLLLETVPAFVRLPQILTEAHGIDEIHIGLNDLHLQSRLDFMFEFLASGLIDFAASQIKSAGVSFGFGGIAAVDGGALPGRDVLLEHVRIGSDRVILGRSFFQGLPSQAYDEHFGGDLKGRIDKLRELEKEFQGYEAMGLASESARIHKRIFKIATELRMERHGE